ncbi:hypothetical protein BJV78DRAFT_663209 [Lactifluus subvellereus]|nr:hypothetical protein BJV78DRAFT_663209 [Lactifluus subvellereus]
MGTSLAGTQQPVVMGLNASIHTLRNEESLQTQECVEVLEAEHATRRACAPTTTFETTSDFLEPFAETGGSQPSTRATDGPESCRNTEPAESDSSGVASGIYTSIHALDQLNTGPYQALDETTEKLGLQPSHTVAGSSSAENGEQHGLTASIHAPGGCRSSQAAKHSSRHSADAPNWAAAARDEDSEKSGSSCPARCGKAQEPALDEDESEPSTTTRCAVQDEEEGSVDNSGGSLDSTDDQEGGTGPGEIENGLDAGTDSNEEGSTTRSRRSRRRGRPRRTRPKMPYLPPPRMRNLTQHPIVDILGAQAQAHGAQAAPSTGSSAQYYGHALPQMPQHGTTQGPIISPSVITHGQLGQHLHYNNAHYMPPPQPVGTSLPPVPNLPPFPPPGPYHPALYSHSPFPQYVSPQVPFASPYGR